MHGVSNLLSAWPLTFVGLGRFLITGNETVEALHHVIDRVDRISAGLVFEFLDEVIQLRVVLVFRVQEIMVAA